jgi:hypothetical protein
MTKNTFQSQREKESTRCNENLFHDAESRRNPLNAVTLVHDFSFLVCYCCNGAKNFMHQQVEKSLILG